MNSTSSKQRFSRHPRESRQVRQTSRVLLHTLRVKVKVALIGAVALLVAAIVSSCGNGGNGPVASTPTPTIATNPTVTAFPTPIPTLSPILTPTPSATPSPASKTALAIFVGNLAPGYDMGVNTSGNRTDWLTVESGEICMAYPSGQSWGAVFITWGKSTPPPRPGKDFSNYSQLSLELQGQSGGESVSIGIKDNSQLDDGTETKVPVSGLSTDWKTFTFPLSQFSGADLQNLYVVIEFVFAGGTSESVCVRNIQYLP